MRKLILYIFCLSLCCCKPSKPFFDFDEVYHYQISEKQEDAFYKDSMKVSQMDKQDFRKIIMGRTYPSGLNDKWYLGKLERFYPKKQKIANNKLNELSGIFSENTQERTEFAACEPIYRDVFIFKKKGKIVGISKICFDCSEQHTIGAKANTHNFGSDNEFERLRAITQ